jgi:membrane-associated phospholipid phosphatase
MKQGTDNPNRMKKSLVLLFLLHFATIYSQNIDIELLRSINLNRNVILDNTFIGISSSVTPLFIGTPAVMLGIGLIKKDTAIVINSLFVGASVFSSIVVSTVLKKAVNRTRPFITYPEIEKMISASSSSFPSGHTSRAFALATSVSLAYPKWYIIAPSFAWAGAVGYSRMHLGVHYPGDVFMGAIVGGGSAYLCYLGQKWVVNKLNKQ